MSRPAHCVVWQRSRRSQRVVTVLRQPAEICRGPQHAAAAALTKPPHTRIAAPPAAPVISRSIHTSGSDSFGRLGRGFSAPASSAAAFELLAAAAAPSPLLLLLGSGGAAAAADALLELLLLQRTDAAGLAPLLRTQQPAWRATESVLALRGMHLLLRLRRGRAVHASSSAATGSRTAAAASVRTRARQPPPPLLADCSSGCRLG